MFRIGFDPAWRIRRGDETGDGQETRQLLRLLARIESHGSIASASRDMQLSYRCGAPARETPVAHWAERSNAIALFAVGGYHKVSSILIPLTSNETS